MFSIGEFARLGDVSIRTLRHYDEIGLLKPAQVDPATGYRGYSADQLGKLNRIMALKELGLSLTQARRLLDGITLDELRGMLVLRSAQLEHELDERRSQLLGVEARLRYIAQEAAMPADDIVVKTVPATGVVALTGHAPAIGAPNIVPVVNQLKEQFDRLRICDRVRETGPFVIFYEYGQGDVTVHLALPVAQPPDDLPAPARYQVLPQTEAAAAVRTGRAASIFPMVYQDLVTWIKARGYRAHLASSREVWVHEVDDIADAPTQQVFEVQVPFTRDQAPAAPDAEPAALGHQPGQDTA
jgi:DNA-binding transcriptional MerR regulator